ncbi:exodeoxyribonuclease I subunit D [Tepidibacillus fermentans]|uniref:Nuclease SbcCD subunit D n=1 Tax=Tepidibacillus fermentans TaxID=1281767 RepID=A0A4R3KK85_9BACI|nr:exodeoxyribonuclease I subunit D [Tepidibacillus fermentans]
MRVLHTADWHLGKMLEGRDRQQEQIEVMEEICKIAEDEKIDLVLIAGDIYQSVNPPAWAEQLFYETIHRLSNYGRRGVVVISGNHDHPERIRAAHPLADKQGIYLFGLPVDQVQATLLKGTDKQIRVIQSGVGWFELYHPTIDEKVIMFTLPYPSEARLKQLLSEQADLREIRSSYSNFIRNWFSSLKSFNRDSSISIAMSHLFVQGGLATDSEVEIQVGGAYTVDPAHLPDYVQYIALGHLHRPQNVKGASTFTRYAGSPLAYSFSEANHKKSVTIVDLKPREKAEYYEIFLSSGKPLIQKTIQGGVSELENWLHHEANQPLWIDLTLHVEHPLSIEEIQRIRKMHEGLIHIKVITPESKQAMNRLENYSKDPRELFERFYQQKMGAAPRKEVVDLFVELFHQQVEEENEI